MKITILGSGTAAPRLDRRMSGHLLEANGIKLLFDSGAGVLYQILKTKTNLLEINHIFYTYLHTDHINDLPAILWANCYKGFNRTESINLYGPDGFKKYFEILSTKIIRHTKKPKFDIHAKEIENKTVEINKIKITTKKLNHFSNLGYRIEHNGKVLVYSGDTGYCKEIIELSKGADVLILECAFPNEHQFEKHLIPKECGEIATKAKVKKLILTHFYPECDDYDLKAQCAETFNGEIILAEDLMEIKL